MWLLQLLTGAAHCTVHVPVYNMFQGKMGKRNDDDDGTKLLSPSALTARHTSSATPPATPQSRTFRALAAETSTSSPSLQSPVQSSSTPPQSPAAATNRDSSSAPHQASIDSLPAGTSSPSPPSSTPRRSTSRSSSQAGPPPQTKPKPSRLLSQQTSSSSSSASVNNGTLSSVDKNSQINGSSTTQ